MYLAFSEGRSGCLGTVVRVGPTLELETIAKGKIDDCRDRCFLPNALPRASRHSYRFGASWGRLHWSLVDGRLVNRGPAFH